MLKWFFEDKVQWVESAFPTNEKIVQAPGKDIFWLFLYHVVQGIFFFLALLGGRVLKLKCSHEFSVWQRRVVLQGSCQGAILSVPVSNNLAPDDVARNQNSKWEP